MQHVINKWLYTPQFSALASISVRRLALAMGVSMPAAVDIIVRLLPSILDLLKVCKVCRDKFKCDYCTSGTQAPQQEQNILSQFTEREQDAIAMVLKLYHTPGSMPGFFRVSISTL